MIKQIGAFAGKRRRVVPDTFDHCLDSLFAELLGDFGAAPGKKARRVRGLRIGAAARLNDLPQPVQGGAELLFGHGSAPNRDAANGETRLSLADAVGSEMKDRGGEDRGGMAVANTLDQMVESADAAGGNDRHAN